MQMTKEMAQDLLIFLANLAWADEKIEQEEIDFLLALRGKLPVEQSFESTLQDILVTIRSIEHIMISYLAVRKYYTQAVDVDAEIGKLIFLLLSADKKIDKTEGEIVLLLKNLEEKQIQLKNVIYHDFTSSERQNDKFFS